MHLHKEKHPLFLKRTVSSCCPVQQASSELQIDFVSPWRIQLDPSREYCCFANQHALELVGGNVQLGLFLPIPFLPHIEALC